MRDRVLWGGLLGLTVLRLVVAAVTPLSPDEAYYWIWSHALAPGYLDHPPMVALWIAAGTAVLGQSALGVRLLGPLGCLGASWLLYDAGRVLFPGTNAGRTGVLLLNASLILGVGSIIMTPDTPLLVFWTATLWAAARIVPAGSQVDDAPANGALKEGASTGGASTGGASNGGASTGGAARGRAGWWLVAGLCAGLALDSKYTAAFLWIGLGVWVIATPSLRGWLRRWEPYAGGLLGVLLFVPVLAWNARRGWVGLLKQGGRVGDWHPARAIGFLAELVGGQAGLATPVIFGLCMVGLVVAVRRGWVAARGRGDVAPMGRGHVAPMGRGHVAAMRHGHASAVRHGGAGDARWSLLASLSVPPILVFVQHALGDRVQGNWPAIIYPALALAAGAVAAEERTPSAMAAARRWVSAGLAIGFGVTALAYLQATTRLFPLPPRLDPISLRLAGWPVVADQVRGAPFVAVEGYAPASEMAWSTAGPVLGTDRRWGLVDLPAMPIAGRTGLLLRDAGRTQPPDPALWASAVPVGPVRRPGATDRGFMLFRVTGAPGVRLVRLPAR
ncbi:MAG TPA: glycosyltransferase family 39 protein [Rhodopila sp.]|uniref:glycosyltransferase family 39 protein n=1 Tax=Rhodopila sp. TaxID=2480087 RepID=UPI002C29DEE2|nr:glycosyltransferase family 39 protein [Rhodopila sp.]HVY18297.1 glycosyltransferase family 39 protein [Rhodopila sp.]